MHLMSLAKFSNYSHQLQTILHSQFHSLSRLRPYDNKYILFIGTTNWEVVKNRNDFLQLWRQWHAYWKSKSI